MQPLPHTYRVEANVQTRDAMTPLTAAGLEGIDTAPPLEFDGPGDQWSPETLLIGAVASCYVLSFRAIAKASKLDWASIACSVEGRLDRIDRQMRFVDLHIAAHLTVEVASNSAERVLQKAKEQCLVSNSLTCDVRLTTQISSGPDSNE